MTALASAGFRHEALIYTSLKEFLTGTVPFIKEGVRQGEPALVVESPQKIDLLREQLGDDASAVTFADMAEVGANPARIIPAWREFVSRYGARAQRLRGIGEPIWKGRSPDELVECQRHESLLNVAFSGGRPWWLLCPYDSTQLAPEVIEEARRSHAFVSANGDASPSDGFRGVEACAAPCDIPLSRTPAGSSWFSFDADRLLTLRRTVSRFATACGLGPVRAAELATAVNEVATNSVVHGGGFGTLRMWRTQNEVMCEVTDKGRYKRPLADRERPGDDPASGRGLWLANQVCDLVQIRTLAEGTVVRLHMKAPVDN